MAYEAITCDTADGVATITLDRPEARNALDDTMASELQDALRKLSRGADARALLLTGSGDKAFCSGQDLRSVTGDNAPETLGAHLRRTWNPIVRALYELPIPTVAAINGVAAGAGASLALACDLRVAADTASVIVVFSKVGLAPDSGLTWLLPRLVGTGKALEMAYLAEPVKADEALRIGLVNRVAAAADLADEAGELARRLAAGPTRAYALTKRGIDRAWRMTLTETLVHEEHLQTAAGRGDDYAEGVAAFLEKRTPGFKGT